MQAIEQMPNPNIAHQASQSAPTAIPVPTLLTTSQTDDDTTTISDAGQVIDDNDLIEKEWVDKARAIIENNRDDPYKQSEGLTNLRAEYMKKQYNKTIKLIK